VACSGDLKGASRCGSETWYDVVYVEGCLRRDMMLCYGVFVFLLSMTCAFWCYCVDFWRL
jgi:hypothetical protein